MFAKWIRVDWRPAVELPDFQGGALQMTPQLSHIYLQVPPARAHDGLGFHGPGYLLLGSNHAGPLCFFIERGRTVQGDNSFDSDDFVEESHPIFEELRQESMQVEPRGLR